MENTTAAKNAKISEAILKQLAVTGDLRTAFDMVLGFGAFKAMSDKLYDELRAKAFKN